MSAVTLQEARTTLPDILHRLMPGEEVKIIDNGRVVGRLLPGDAMTESVHGKAPGSDAITGLRPPPGLGQGLITVIADDDDYLIDFVDYMP